ncbi:MAG TPA: ferrous iron transporter B [Firmicutes bacterium]|jgi:ferrous iron transport protein B|nr:ferrous iron transporter B [Bacillota bacterium]
MARLNPNQAAALQQASQLAADLPTPSHDQLVHSIYDTAQTIAELVVKIESGPKITWQERLDRVLTSPWLGFPVMITLLVIVFWLTFEGANHPSEMLSALFHVGEDFLSALFITMNAPTWLHGLLVLGIYRSTAWVVSVMLPPMAIFFPLFTLLEDLGYLPRVAFNLDRFFQWAGAHGKQALTMSMGFGCNAAGVIACRIIDSPRERLVAILTNTFVPCNGRFPTFIALSSIFLGSTLYGVDSGFLASFAVLSLILVGIGTTLGVSWLLTRTLLRGVPSAFVLELPPYRPPQVGRILVRSVLDRTIHVLMRAIVWAAPAGAVTWILANTPLGSETMLSIAAGHLDKFARCLGLDGVILLAFFLGLPANEIVLPIVVMGYLAEGALLWPGSLSELQQLLVAHGWTAKTAILVMLFSLLHFPCSTTLWTIKKETGSKLWTAVAFLLPLTLACTVLFLLNLLLPSL